MPVIKFKSTWHRMKELVIISLNIIYIKDLLQFYERMQYKTSYVYLSIGPIEVMIMDCNQRKHSLNLRMKSLLEDLMNSKRTTSENGRTLWGTNSYTENVCVLNFVFNIPIEHASLTKKQLEKGYAIFNNIQNVTFALNLRNGSLLQIKNYEGDNTIDANLKSLEYTAKHDGAVYKYFDIDQSDPLKNNIRY